MERIIGVIGLVAANRKESCGQLNEILSGSGEVVMGRIGLPYRDRGVSLLSLLVDGSAEELAVLIKKIEELPDVIVKVALHPQIELPDPGNCWDEIWSE